MDPVSAVASIANLIEALTECYSFLRSMTEARTEMKILLIEICSLRGNLRILADFLDIEDDETWRHSVAELKGRDGPLEQLQSALDRLSTKIGSPRGIGYATRILFWKAIKEETKDILSRIERLKTLVLIALEMNHAQLSLAIRKDVLAMRGTLDHSDYLSLLRWLSPLNYDSILHKNLNAYHDGTAEWFLNDPVYRKWQSDNDAPDILFCPGNPGTGKSVITAVIVDRLRKFVNVAQSPVLYLSCDYRLQNEQTIDDIMGNLLKQLTQIQGKADSKLHELRRRHEVTESRPSTNELQQILFDLFARYERVYVVVDALDECEGNTRTKLISTMEKLRSSCKLRLLVTSRCHISEVQKFFESENKILIRAHDEDVRAYVLSRIAECDTDEANIQGMAENIAEKVIESSDGVFLLARLHMNSLTEKKCSRDLKQAIRTLPSGPDEHKYDSTYEIAMHRIESQSEENSQLAKTVLEWITCARRPLRLKELQHALAVREHDVELDLDGIYRIDILLNACCGLLEVVEENADEDALPNRYLSLSKMHGPFVQLVHFTTQEYFNKYKDHWFPKASLDLSKTCITYLSFAPFKSGPCKDIEDLQQLFLRYSLLEYASRNWGLHAQDVEKTNKDDHFCSLLELSIPFMQNGPVMDLTTQVDLFNDRHFTLRAPTSRSIFHVVAKYDLSKTCAYLLKTIGYTETRDSRGFTPIHIAARYGSPSALSLLLACESADANARGTQASTTPLITAAYNGNHRCTEILSQLQRVDVNAEDSCGQTALAQAARTGNIDVFRNLLASPKIEINRRDLYGETPLSKAIRNGHVRTIQQLLGSSKLSPSDSELAKERICQLQGSVMDRETLCRLLKDAHAYEADWRKAAAWSPAPDGSPGTCLFLLGRVQNCDTLAPDGGPLCVLCPNCSMIREACRKYKESHLKTYDLAWYNGLLWSLAPWLLRDMGLAGRMRPGHYANAISYKADRILCDVCSELTSSHGYHCEECNDDNYDVCSTCVGKGYWCFDRSHAMFFYDFRGDNESIDVCFFNNDLRQISI